MTLWHDPEYLPISSVCLTTIHPPDKRSARPEVTVWEVHSHAHLLATPPVLSFFIVRGESGLQATKRRTPAALVWSPFLPLHSFLQHCIHYNTFVRHPRVNKSCHVHRDIVRVQSCCQDNFKSVYILFFVAPPTFSTTFSKLSSISTRYRLPPQTSKPVFHELSLTASNPSATF